MTKIYSKSKSYCMQQFSDAESGTIHAFGTTLKLEVPYRCYGEFETFMRFAGLPKGSRVLELGSGTGRWGFALAPYVDDYIGVDLNSSLVEDAKKRAEKEKIDNVIFVQGDISDYLANSKEEFDLIYIAGVSLYFSDQNLEDLLRLVSMRLKKTGQIVERTTTSPETHEIDRQDYAALYRSDADIEKLFLRSLDGFELSRVTRSYPFLRGRLFYRVPDALYRKSSFFNKFFRRAPVIKIMQFFSRIAERFSPSLSIEDDKSYDHKFFFFRRVLPR